MRNALKIIRGDKMAHLEDMEELLLKVKRTNIREYMREALDCYMAGAYQGCIVLSYIALFDDLTEKLSELSFVNSDARKIHNEINKRKQNQDVYENYLINKLSSEKILSKLECSSLTTIKERRNKAAHPSGHKASAEEARFIYYEVINKFLSKPILITTQLVDEIILRLENDYFFPSRNKNEIVKVVKKEIDELHPSAFNYLITKLIKLVLDEDKTLSRNSKFFLIGLSSLKDKNLVKIIKEKLITKKIDDINYNSIIISCISCKSEIIKEIDEITLSRFKKVISDSIRDDNIMLSSSNNLSHPSYLFNKLSQKLEISLVYSSFSDEIELFLEYYPYEVKAFSNLLCIESFYSTYLNLLKNNASSGSFDIANTFASNIKEIQEDLNKYIKPKDALELIIAILSAAEGGAWISQSLRDNKFESIENIKNKAEKYIRKNTEKETKKIIKEYIIWDYDYEEFINEFFEE